MGQVPRMDVLLKHKELVVPTREGIFCLVHLRTNMLRELAHTTLRTHHSFLVVRGTNVD